jgi:predicted hotdog family 3-hydroxylacyl-ACP dehydratase
MSGKNISREEIKKRVPHQGHMCLLEHALEWDETHIVCSAVSHRDPANPLRENGVLPAVCGIEYAAQAMALHGSLLGLGTGTGVLAGVRELVLSVERLDDCSGQLIIEAEKLLVQEQLALYRFSLRTDARELLRGRAAVAFASER